MTRLGLYTTIIFWLAMAMLPLVVRPWDLVMFSQLLIYGIAAMSLALIWGQGGLLCFGQALFFGVGAYVMALTGKGLIPGIAASAWLGLGLATLSGALVALLAGFALFFGQALRGPYFGIVTIAAAVIVERFATNWRYIGGYNGLLDIEPLSFALIWPGLDSAEPLAGYLTALLAAFAVFLLLNALVRSPFGTVLRGLRADEQRVASLGYSVGLWKTIAFCIGGGTAALSGALFAVQFSFVSPAVIGFAMSTEILIWAAVGGKEVLLAAMAGAAVVKYFEAVLSDAIGHYYLLVIGIIFIVVVVALPRGLLGRLFELPRPQRLRADGISGHTQKHRERADAAAPMEPRQPAPGKQEDGT
ncbi:MAG: ABC-type high affinity urea uptake system permease component UrtC [Rhodobacteraceae bacterium HLUCCA12]|nr:MAG: ABC-type high affinity urea uptake system permease component UrtC [Rhodobacteraceae bacterium HLUCCA12]